VSLALVIASLKTGTYAVSRPGADTYAAGIRTAGAPTAFNADMSIQPISGRDLRAMPEGIRAEDARAVWSSTELRVGDVITISGEPYAVHRVQTHAVLEPPFYRAWIARQVMGV
jgi:hypothetical protein